VLALVGLIQSGGHVKKETLRIDVKGEADGEQRRAPELVTTRRRGLHGDFEGLRIVQITDPHLGRSCRSSGCARSASEPSRRSPISSC
jgi:hypothetical protein